MPDMPDYWFQYANKYDTKPLLGGHILGCGTPPIGWHQANSQSDWSMLNQVMSHERYGPGQTDTRWQLDVKLNEAGQRLDTQLPIPSGTVDRRFYVRTTHQYSSPAASVTFAEYPAKLEEQFSAPENWTLMPPTYVIHYGEKGSQEGQWPQGDPKNLRFRRLGILNVNKNLTAPQMLPRVCLSQSMLKIHFGPVEGETVCICN